MQEIEYEDGGIGEPEEDEDEETVFFIVIGPTDSVIFLLNFGLGHSVKFGLSAGRR